jgi:hypothetical protein
MPTQYRVGRDNRCNLHHTAATEARAAGSQPPPVVVREPHAVGAQLRLQDAILLPQLLDDLLLLVPEPADNEGDQQVQRNHASSLRLRRIMFSDTFMKRLCQVTRLVEAAVGLCRQTSSERAQPSHPAKRDGRANGSHVVSFVVKRRSFTPPWRGGSPFYARSGWHSTCAGAR